ncbi:hypothetical protein IAT38_004207 [Cryptococcus sp. DSM 104549]
MSRIPVPHGGLQHSIPHSPPPPTHSHSNSMSSNSPANAGTRMKQSKRDEVRFSIPFCRVVGVWSLCRADLLSGVCWAGIPLPEESRTRCMAEGWLWRRGCGGGAW